MKKKMLILAGAILGLAVVAPPARADDYDRLQRDRAELRKDTEQMHDAWHDGSRRGVENEQREIAKDRAALARDHAAVSGDYYNHGSRWRHRDHRDHAAVSDDYYNHGRRWRHRHHRHHHHDD